MISGIGTLNARCSAYNKQYRVVAYVVVTFVLSVATLLAIFGGWSGLAIALAVLIGVLAVGGHVIVGFRLISRGLVASPPRPWTLRTDDDGVVVSSDGTEVLIVLGSIESVVYRYPEHDGLGVDGVFLIVVEGSQRLSVPDSSLGSHDFISWAERHRLLMRVAVN